MILIYNNFMLIYKNNATCRELETFMRKHEMEKAQLVERMTEQSQTVHHLTHHVHLLQSAQEAGVACPPIDLDLSAGTFGGKYPLFFTRNEHNEHQKEHAPGLVQSSNGQGNGNGHGVGHGNVHMAEPWPMSDHLEQINSLNMSQISTSFAPGISFSTATSTPHPHPHPVKNNLNDMHDALYQQQQHHQQQSNQKSKHGLYQQQNTPNHPSHFSVPEHRQENVNSNRNAYANANSGVKTEQVLRISCE